jgi:hypothetical protein
MAANPPVTIRFRAIDIAYLEELGKIGGYGKGRNGVIRRFVENGIVRAIERGVVVRKNAADFPEPPAADDED